MSVPDERMWLRAKLGYLRLQYETLSRITLQSLHLGIQPPYDAKNELRRLAGLIEEIRSNRLMSRVMCDSTDPTLIPSNVDIVAYYPHAWGTNITSHEHALVVSIDNRGDHADDCHILDVETGAASNAIAAEWVQSWHKLHPNGMSCVNGYIGKPVLYTSTANLAALREACKGLTYDTWAAQWDGNTTPVPGCFAKQYIDHGPNGENYDVSAVYDETWGHAPTPQAPTPTPTKSVTSGPIQGLVTWADNSWAGHARLVTSDDGGHTWH